MPIPKRTFVTLVMTASLIALAFGCAGPANIGSNSPAALTGTWRGSFGMVLASHSPADANVTLTIKDDGTYSLIATRAAGANNKAPRVFQETGAVVPASDRIAFQNSDGICRDDQARACRVGRWSYSRTGAVICRGAQVPGFCY
jgi:hypothetical protein